jgi:hypothetical protein
MKLQTVHNAWKDGKQAEDELKEILEKLIMLGVKQRISFCISEREHLGLAELTSSTKRKVITKGDDQMTSFSFWQKWLFVVGVIISIFGAMMAFLSGTPVFDLFNRQIDPAFWGSSALGDSTKRFQEWIYGVWGATTAGWGIFLTFIAHYPFGRRERWSWNCMVAGLAVWFVLDTSLSIYHRVYFNAAFNTVLMILAGLPVAVTRKHFTS